MKRFCPLIFTAIFHIIAAYPLITSSVSAAPSAKMTFISPDKTTGCSAAVVVDSVPLVHTAQFLSVDTEGRMLWKNDPAQQTVKVLSNISVALKEAKSDLNQIVKLNVYLAKTEIRPQVEAALAKKFSGATKPAVTFVTGSLSQANALVAMDAVAVTTIYDEKVRLVHSKKLSGSTFTTHAAILPASSPVYVSGQADKGALPEATKKTLEKLGATLTFLGLGKEDVVQLKCFLQPMSDTAKVQQELRNYFGETTTPPVVFVDWVSKDIPIEIELIATSPKVETAERVSYLTPPGMTPSNVYAKVARVNSGRLVYISGIYGRTATDAEGEVREIFAVLQGILNQSGSDLEHLVKSTYYVSNNQTSGKLNELRPKFYNPKRPPAASKALIKDVGLPEKAITFDMIAVTKE